MSISEWSSIPIENSDAPPEGAPEGMAAGLVNDVIRENMAVLRQQHERAEWIDEGWSVSRTSATQFAVLGVDATSTFSVGRRILLEDSTTLYGDITSVTYTAPDTVVDVALDSGSLTIALSAVSVGIINAENSSLRQAAFLKPNIGLLGQGTELNINWGTLTSDSAPDVDQSTLAIRNGPFHYEIPVGAISSGIPGHAERLRIDPGTAPNNVVQIRADRVVLTGPDGALAPVRNVDATCDIRNSGVGGLDTGSAQDDTWYYIYVISNRSDVNVIMSADRFYGVTRPGGYDYLGQVGAVYYKDSGSQLEQQVQRGKTVYYLKTLEARNSSQSANQWAGLDVSGYAPQTATDVCVTLGNNTSPIMGVAPTSDGRGGQYFTSNAGSGSSSNFAGALDTGRNHTVSAWCPIGDSRRIWTFFGGSPVVIHVTGYRLE